MKFHLEIDCDNAAFEDDPAQEIACILKDAVEQIKHWQKPVSWPIFDTNGNRVGRAWIEE